MGPNEDKSYLTNLLWGATCSRDVKFPFSLRPAGASNGFSWDLSRLVTYWSSFNAYEYFSGKYFQTLRQLLQCSFNALIKQTFYRADKFSRKITR
jgi:hypothetical protein